MAERAHELLDHADGDGLPLDAMFELILSQIYDRAVTHKRVWAMKSLLDRLDPVPCCRRCARRATKAEPWLAGVDSEVSNPRLEP